MKSFRIFLWLSLLVAQVTIPSLGQTGPGPIPTNLLDRWADAETVQNWVRAIRAGRTALKDGHSAEATAAFRKAIEICEPKAAGKIHQCIARLLLAETVLADGFNDEALVQTDQLVARLKKATRYTELRKVDGDTRHDEEEAINCYNYQVGAALYMRAARIYLRLNLPKRAEPLFKSATQIFEQVVYLYNDYNNGQSTTGSYGLAEYRVAEILEAQGRFHLITGNDKKALESFQVASAYRNVKKTYSFNLPEGMSIVEYEKFVDTLVAERLEKSSLQRLLDDCAFYRFDDARIAVLLDRQAELLKKVGRGDEAVAFEKFAESLRKKPLPR